MDLIAHLQKKLAEAARKAFGQDVSPEAFSPERPPNPEMGDLAFPCFPLAKALRMGPPVIAAKLAAELSDELIQEALPAGPYLNLRLNIAAAFAAILPGALDGSRFSGGLLDPALPEGERRTIALEFSCPNTNKPQHLGHVRNNVIGDGLARLLSAAGHRVIRVNLINDRGIHICKSMLAWERFGNGETPDSTGEKGDHLVGRYYVRFAQELDAEQQRWAEARGLSGKLSDEDKARFEAESELMGAAREMLGKWEAGDKAVHQTWNTMNGWVFQGFDETYTRMGIRFDKVYRESEIWKLGRSEVEKGLEQGLLFKHESGAVMCSLEELKLDPKVLLRSDGTAIYMTQDLGNAVMRQDELHFDDMIYVVGSEQEHHFRVLFFILKKLGYDWADNLQHYSYGMVNLTTGKMKSREGRVVDADDLLDELENGVRAVMDASERRVDMPEEERERVTQALAAGALRYFVLKVNPAQDMLYDPEESVDLAGNTGPYLQYARARMGSLVRKSGVDTGSVKDFSLLVEAEERELLQHLAFWRRDIQQAAQQRNPARVAQRSYELARSFSRFFNAHSIFDKVEDRKLAEQRVALTAAVGRTLEQGLELMGIPAPERI